MLDFLQKITEKIDTIKLPYMLSGSVAMGFYAIQRTTRDIDLVIEMQEKDIKAICELFKDGYYCHKPAIEDALRNNGMFNVIDTSTGFKVDFILRKNANYDKSAFERKKLTPISEGSDMKYWVISLEDLIIAKIRWIQELVSERQIEDIENLLRNPLIDLDYLNFWIKELKLKTYHIKF